jgi:hypothetical protein
MFQRVRPLTYMYVLLNLKRSGIPPEHLITFYKLCLQPVMTYACAAWYPMLTESLRNRITSLERLELKILYPSLESYSDRIAKSGLSAIEQVLENGSVAHMAKIKQEGHCLHHLLPPTKSKTGRHSARLKDIHIVKCRTVLRKSSFILAYSNF